MTAVNPARQIIYKTWDDGFLVRRMTKKDAKLAQTWFSDICPTACDLELALSLFPEDSFGFYIGEYEGDVVASAIRIPVAEGVYYGSYYYVVERHRSKGFGKRLRDDVAQPHIGDNILAIDAHDNLLGMNKKRGYTEGFKVTGCLGEAPGLSRKTQHSIHKVEDIDFTKLLDFDSQCFVRRGSQLREAFLRKWVTIIGGSTAVVTDSNDDVIGYGCRRPALVGGSHLIGPLYATSSDVAYDVMAELCRDIAGSHIMINICEPSHAAVRLMRELGLHPHLHMVRMYLNGDPRELNPYVYALTSIDVCGF